MPSHALLEGFAATAHPNFVNELGGSLEDKAGPQTRPHAWNTPLVHP